MVFADLTKKGKALFSMEESARAHAYIKWANPFETAFTLIIVGAVFGSFLLFFMWNWSVMHVLFLPTSLKCLIVLVFPLSVFALLFFYRRSYTHVCYEHQLKLNMSVALNNQRYRWISAKNIECLKLKGVRYKGEGFVMAKVIFKPYPLKFLGRPWDVRFGISDRKGLDGLRSWASTQGITVTEEESVIIN